MSSSCRGVKRSLSNGESSSSVTKWNREECRFGIKCYRKNPTHFDDFEHTHLNDIISRWKDEKNLPPDVDEELKRHTVIVLEQLKIVRDIHRNRGLKVENPKPGHSKERSPKLREFSNAAANRKSEVHAVNKDNTNDNPVNEGHGSRSPNPISDKVAKMIHEATKHHGDVQAKLDAAAPYNFFLTSVSDSPSTHKEHLTITFTELLDKSLGDLESSLQINFMVELGWLLAQYFYTGNRFKPLTLLYGVEDEDLKEVKKIPNNVTAVKVKTPNAFGHHHTKMSVLAYKDKSIRIIISTANLVESDWENRTQGLWVSPRLPQLPHDADTASGESPTQFKADLLSYLTAYRLPQLQEWLSKIRNADFSSVRVFLVASVPGTHYGPELNLWGHRRLRSLLKQHVHQPESPCCPWNKWPVIGQFSSIGTLGVDFSSWVGGELLESMSMPSTPMSKPPIKLIYPSLDDVKGSHDGLLGGACLPYQKKVHQKQEWLTKFLCHWESSGRFRTRAMPHIKSYGRVSPCHSFLAYFLLTSANLSKAAWGCETKTRMPGQGLRILSYEAGVLFLPTILVEDDIFYLENPSRNANHGSCGSGTGKQYPPFPLHYDLPLHAYKPNETPWFYDIFYET